MKTIIICVLVFLICHLGFTQEVHSITVSVNQPETCEVILGVNLDASNTAFEIFPIPAHNHLTISADEIIDDIILLDLQGKEIITVKPYRKEYQIPVNNIPKGVYLLKLFSGKGIHQYKILIGQ